MAWGEHSGQSRQLPGERDSPNINPDGSPWQRWPLGDDRHSRGNSLSVPPGGQLIAGPQVRGDDDTGQALTITVQPTPGADIGISAQPQLRASLTWGQGGAMHVAELDVGNGIVVSIWASSMQVGVRNLDPAPTVDEIKNPVPVWATVNYLPIGQSEAVLSERTASVAAASFEELPVPAFAVDVEVQSNILGGTVTIEQRSPTGIVLSSAAAVVPSARIPLVNGARIVRLINTAGVAQSFIALFSLAF